MESNQIAVGSVVLSLKGRDTGRIYLVKRIETPYLYLCDGDAKKLSNPKKKKDKHVKLLGAASAIGAKLTDGRQVFDSEIYSALRGFNANEIKN